MLVCV